MNMKTGIEMIAEERQRQIDVEDYNEQHDSQHKTSSFIKSALSYIESAKIGVTCMENGINNTVDIMERKDKTGRFYWPWKDGFKVSTDVRDLVKAGALIAAAIDRLQKEPMAVEISESQIKWLKSIKDNITEEQPDQTEISVYRELLGHSSQDIDTLE